MEVNMEYKMKNTLSILLKLSLFFSLLTLTACTAMVSASGEPTASAPLEEVVTEVPAEVVTEPIVEVDTEPTPEAPTNEPYINIPYRFTFEIPPEWMLSEYPVGEGVSGYAPSQAVELVKGDYRLLVHIKVTWDSTVIGGALGPGEVVNDTSLSLLDQAVNRNRLVNEERTSLVWYAGCFDDLELYIRLEDISGRDYAEIDIPDEVVAEVEDMLSTFTRTGEPLTPPVNPTPKPQPTVAPVSVTCDLLPRLSVNGWAQVTPGLPNAVRSAPGRGLDSIVVGEIQAGTTMQVLEGPVCASGYQWWKVDAGMITGWTAEGFAGVYWLDPLTEGTPVAVDGWVGRLVSTPDWPQVDDYFQMLDQGGTRYGIHALDETLRQQLEATRDTGTLIRIWGTLYYGRMDAYNTQIEVTRFEIYTP